MGDSWEDWDTEEVPVPIVTAAVPAAAAPPKTFDDEDAEEDEPKWKANIPQTQASKPRISKYDESRGAAAVDEGPLDDPIAEKLRQQKLVEDADYEATMDLFGKSIDLETFVPKSAKDFDDLGKALAAKYLLPHSKVNAASYKGGIKALLHAALRPLSASETKDIETVVAGIRSDKLKAEKAAIGGKKSTKKATLNLGRDRGSAGLEDYIYDDAGDGDDFEFM
jgi:translation initiation factor 3 subunit J